MKEEDFIKHLLKENKDYTQRDLAYLMGCSLGKVNKIINNSTEDNECNMESGLAAVILSAADTRGLDLNYGSISVIEHQLKLLKKYFINEVYIITGKCNERYEHLKSENVHIIYNDDYNNSGNLLSLFKVANIEKDFIVVDSDCIFDEYTLAKLMFSKHKNILTYGEYIDEKNNLVAIKNNKIINISANEYSTLEMVFKLNGINKISSSVMKKMYHDYMNFKCKNNKIYYKYYLNNYLQFFSAIRTKKVY